MQLQTDVWMFVTEWKWLKKDDSFPYLSLLSRKWSVLVKENLDKKKFFMFIIP